MAQSSKGAVQRHELEELAARVEYLDEQRLKSTKQIDLLEQANSRKDEEIERKDRQIKDLEARLSALEPLLNDRNNLDAILDQFKDDVVGLIDQYNDRHSREIQEAERIRRTEYETLIKDLQDLRQSTRKYEPVFEKLDLQHAEDLRLSNLIGKVQSKISSIESRMENWDREMSFINANDQQRAKNLSRVENEQLDLLRKVEGFSARLDTTNHRTLRLESDLQKVSESSTDNDRIVKSWVDTLQLGEFERNQRISKQDEEIAEYKVHMERYTQEFATFVEQNSEAKQVLQTITDWRQEIEAQQQEVTNLSRIGLNRIQVSWDDFVTDMEKRWRAFVAENEQKFSEGTRRDKAIEEQIALVEGQIKGLITEKNTLLRIQSAQLDAIKQLPRLWQDEVDKAKARDPERRREPSMVPVEDEVY